MVMTMWSGQDLVTVADLTWVMPSSRRAAAWVSTRIIGSLGLMAATDRTVAGLTRWVPWIATERTTSSLEPSRAQPMPTTRPTTATAMNAVRHGLCARASDPWGRRPASAGPPPEAALPVGSNSSGPDSATDTGA